MNSRLSWTARPIYDVFGLAPSPLIIIIIAIISLYWGIVFRQRGVASMGGRVPLHEPNVTVKPAITWHNHSLSEENANAISHSCYNFGGKFKFNHLSKRHTKANFRNDGMWLRRIQILEFHAIQGWILLGILGEGEDKNNDCDLTYYDGSILNWFHSMLDLLPILC